MGYTHYFTQKKQPTDEQWQSLKEKVIEVYDTMQKQKKPIGSFIV